MDARPEGGWVDAIRMEVYDERPASGIGADIPDPLSSEQRVDEHHRQLGLLGQDRNLEPDASRHLVADLDHRSMANEWFQGWLIMMRILPICKKAPSGVRGMDAARGPAPARRGSRARWSGTNPVDHLDRVRGPAVAAASIDAPTSLLD
jgi:hypothetical protein